MSREDQNTLKYYKIYWEKWCKYELVKKHAYILENCVKLILSIKWKNDYILFSKK